jgi:hypothetical protein
LVGSSQGVENWIDPTNVLDLNPPAGSKLATVWDEQTTMEFIETPLSDALGIIGTMHGVRFDLSHLAGERIEKLPNHDLLVTFNVTGISFENGLGALLYTIDCQAHLDGETIVIELQPDHPAAKKP